MDLKHFGLQWVSDENWSVHDLHLKHYFSAKYKRPSLIFDHTPGIHTLLGPRRIGKSTQFKLWILELLKQSTSPDEIFYLNAECYESWQELLKILESITSKYWFIDEVTAVKDWPRALKILADEGRFESRTVWITGSNAFDLKNLGERLPGRRGHSLVCRDIELLPLTFREFYLATKNHFNTGVDAIFEKFCQWGGYPMAVSECLQLSEPSFDLLQEMVDVFLGETSRKHRSPRLTAALAEVLWLQLGSRSSYNALAKAVDAGSHPILKQYVEILEGCYALMTVERYNQKTHRGVVKKEKKFYFLDSLTMGALSSFSETGIVQSSWFKKNWENLTFQGRWIENIVASEFRKQGIEVFYDMRYGMEIDFIWKLPSLESNDLKAVEVKRSVPSQLEIRGLKEFRKGEVWIYQFPATPPQNRPELKPLLEMLLLEEF
ncbi:MAG: ATP-binding protein [Deltaproteobacteria bacterium]|nr:ATP-binding protein [Deltaproteobacteria bacterium]